MKIVIEDFEVTPCEKVVRRCK